MWRLIAKVSPGRAIVLTTHSMEEAESLSTKIGITVSGRLRCIGTGQQIKQRYGTGFQIDFTSSGRSSERALRWVQETFETSQVLEVHENSLKVRTGKERSLGQIFGLIEDAKDNLDVTDYSVSETTLEQIFIHFARDQQQSKV